MRSILVTGGGRGIGRAIALAFSGAGTLVAIASRTADQVAATAREIEARGGRALGIPMDVADPGSVAAAFERISAVTPTLDVLVNNAGIGGGEPIAGSDIDRWHRMLDVNLFGMYLVARQAMPLLSDGARIINMSSVLGRFGVPGYTAYCASKHGVIGFTRALALELAPRRITVNALCPGWVETDMAVEGMTLGARVLGATYEQFRAKALKAVPLKRIIDPGEVARLAVFLASDDASAITGQAYNICGGQTMD